MTQALAAGYRRVQCCAEIEDAHALAATEGPAKLAGERRLQHIEGFDFGNSPRELTGEPAAETLILSTTNGTRLLVAASARFEQVFVGSLLNLAAVAHAARETGEDVAVLCAGVLGELALDDAYCAGRIVDEIGGEPSDAAIAASTLAAAWPDPLAGLNARTYGPPGLEDDIRHCAQVDYVSVVPRFTCMKGASAEIRRDHD
jgi:2-phosphosulfolactate phosphatase